MRFRTGALALLLALGGIGLPPAPLQAQTTAVTGAEFSSPGIANEAARYETWLKASSKPGRDTARTHKAAAERTLAAGGDPRIAAISLGAAVVVDGKDAAAWNALSRALLAIPAASLTGADRFEIPMQASSAAYLSHLRAATKPAKATALATLAEALIRRSQHRNAILAYRASLELVDEPVIRADYDKVRAEHGFRITEYKTENEAAQPRLCIQFSERLSTRQTDPAKFVTVDGRDAASVVVEGQQMCVEGLVHGRRYAVQVRSGIAADAGDVLGKTADLTIYVKDRAPTVRLSGKSYVLPSRGQQGLPMVTVNTDKVAIEIYRVGDRSIIATLQNGELLQRQTLGTYDLEQLRDRTGARIYSGTMDVAQRQNEEVTTAIPIGDAIPELKPGVYAVVAKPATRSSANAQDHAVQWFVISDLGLTTFSGETGIHVFVRSLATANPTAGAKVRLIARNNDVLGELKSDANGYVRFPGGLKKGEGGLAPAMIAAEGQDAGDFAFLDLDTQAFDLSDRGVGGREAPGPLDGFVYLDRGVYRPGETVHLSALVRDRSGRASALPMTLILSRPDGVEHSRTVLTDQGLGGRTTSVVLAGGAMTGTWRAKLHADPKSDPLAASAFLVEDFVPERIDLKLAPATASIGIERPAAIDLTGRYLYGPPADDLAIEGEIVVKPSAKDLPGLPGYRFGLADDKVTPVRKPLEGLGRTDKAGVAKLSVALPPVPRTGRLLEAEVIVRLREAGGRTIERTVTMPVDTQAARLGIKPQFADGMVGEGETAKFDTVLIDAAGQPLASKQLTWTLHRLDQSWQWYSRDGQWTYEAVTHTHRIANGTAETQANGIAAIAAAVDYGRYRLDVAGTDGSTSVASSLVFNAGWYAAETVESPEQLDVALDKPSYSVGTTAKLRIASRTGGKALVNVIGDGVFRQQMVEVAKGNTETSIEITSDLAAGAYVTAVLYRPMDISQKRMPSRAIGVRWIGIDQSPRTLGVELGAAAQVKSRSKLDVPIRVTGLTVGEQARVTVAAVDVGILNLTRFAAPEPQKWLYQQRRLATEIRDLYGRLIDGMRAERGKLRSGGDAGGGMALKGSPPVEATVAMFSGIVTVGADGTAKTEFQLPEFNGSVRLMAVAWSEGKVGSGSADVIVRDAVAVTASAPRFLSYGDEARLDISLHNVELPAGELRLQIEETPAGGTRRSLIDRRIALKSGERRAEPVSIKPTVLGLATYHVQVTGPAGLDITRTLTLDVKPPAADIRRVFTAALPAGGGKFKVTSDLLADLIPGRARIAMSVGPAARLDVPGLLSELDRYPYGCTEQTVSRALPLLSFNALAAEVGLVQDAGIKERVQGAITRVFEMQDSTGAFGVWGPRSADMWLTSYVADFLTRAKEAGYTVNPRGFAQMMDRLQNFISYAQDFERGGEARAYALYVLARAGRAPIGDLRYFVDTRLDRFSTPLAQAQLGAALAMVGDKERAETAFRAALASLKGPETVGYRSDYGTNLRDSAALVALAAETRVLRDDTPRLSSVLASAFAGRRYTSTQEQAWLLLAAKALSDQSADTRLTIGGQSVKGALNRRVQASELTDAGLTIVNDGDNAVDAVVSVVGVALTAEPAVSRGLKLERSYYTMDGKAFDLKSATGGTAALGQNDRLVAVLKVDVPTEGGRLMVVDRLPAGLEIENPRLVDGGDVRTLAWLKTAIKPEHTEFRDDRFVAAFNLRPGGAAKQPTEEPTDGEDDAAPADGAKTAEIKQITVAYIVRAVTPGSFTHPAATVEDMYRPERFARTGAGRLEIKARAAP